MMLLMSPQCGSVAPVWVLVAAFYGLLVLGLFCFAAILCMNIGILFMNEFQFMWKHRGLVVKV